jgi:CubicO group peptidase (beta-lactamase class C family)
MSLILLVFLAVGRVCAWTPPSTNEVRDISNWLTNFQGRMKLPAVAIAMVKEDRVFAAGAIGVRKWGEIANVTINDKFHIGSCTKSFTALLAVMKRDRLGLDAAVKEVFPDWDLPMDGETITLRLLLQNRSGIGNSPDPKLWESAFLVVGSPEKQREKFLREVLKAPLEAEPETKYIYSNLGFALAGAMLEQKIGRPWEQMIREEIFGPMKLDSAGFGPPSPEAALDQPWGHQYDDEGSPSPVPPGDNPIAIAPAGLIHMSIIDLAKYAAFHLAAARGEIPELRNQREVLYSAPEGSDYAFGWLVKKRTWAGGKALTHSGSNTMFFSVIWIAPEKNFAIVVSTNIGERDGSVVFGKCDEIVAALISEFAPK